MVKCLLLNDNTKVQIILLIKKRGSRMLNFAFYCGFIWLFRKKAVLLQQSMKGTVRHVFDTLCEWLRIQTLI